MGKTAIVDGISGQDGSYLVELLLLKGYRVIGLKRRTSLINTQRIDHLIENSRFELRYSSLFDPTATYRLLQEYKPQEYYHLAAQSHVRVSFETPVETMQGIVMGTAYILEAIRTIVPTCKFYQASSSEMFGRNTDVPLNEKSEMLPASPYACAKLAAHHLVQNYRESYNLFACSGILFNHESPRRGETFVTRKITRAAAEIKAGKRKELHLGNLHAKRDWGFAGDYVEGMWLMLQHPYPDDYVLATGETHSVREFLDEVFALAGLDVDEHVKFDARLLRPQEVPILLGDSTKAQQNLDWAPRTTFKSLAKIMFEADWEKVNEE